MKNHWKILFKCMENIWKVSIRVNNLLMELPLRRKVCPFCVLVYVRLMCTNTPPPSASLCLIHIKPLLQYITGVWSNPKNGSDMFLYSRPEKSCVLSEEKWKLIDDVTKETGNSRQAQCMKIVLESIVQRGGRTICLVCDTERDGFKKWCVALLKYATGFEKIA